MAAGGRPLRFLTPALLEHEAEAYFKDIAPEKWTITGLALALDTSRETLMNYEAKDEFFDTIKRLKSKIEYAYEMRGMEKNTAFDIFRLKNMGWKDKTETDITSNGETVGQADPLVAAEFAAFMKHSTEQ